MNLRELRIAVKMRLRTITSKAMVVLGLTPSELKSKLVSIRQRGREG